MPNLLLAALLRKEWATIRWHWTAATNLLSRKRRRTETSRIILYPSYSLPSSRSLSLSRLLAFYILDNRENASPVSDYSKLMRANSITLLSGRRLSFFPLSTPPPPLTSYRSGRFACGHLTTLEEATKRPPLQLSRDLTQ